MSCHEDEGIPSYIHVSHITLSTNPQTEGSSSARIVDAWVYDEGQEQGVYQLPATFPILAEGMTRINVYAGILKNGVSSTRSIYPFYTPDTFLIELAPTRIDTIYPGVRYVANAIFDFVEDFEGGNTFSNLVRISDDNVFEGGFSAKMLFPDDSTIVVSKTNRSYNIPSLSAAVYLEMNYKCNHMFQVGITGISGAETLSVVKLNLNPRDDWNKIYIDFTPEVNGIRAGNYEIFFRIIPASPGHAIDLYLDNIKLIHFNVS